MKPIVLIAAAATASMAAAFCPANAYAASNSTFIKRAIRGDNSEIRLGALAEHKGDSAGVRRFCKTLVTEHTRARREADAVAKKLHVTPPTRATTVARAEYKKLSGMKGAAFDREFTSYMVTDHKNDIRDFKKQEKAGHSPTASFARKSLPMLRKHLRIAQRLSQRPGSSSSQK